MDDLICRQAAIDVDGLDEEIRCEICRNPMHTNRGCDGNCKYDEKLYERIMQILDERIKPLPSAPLDAPDTNVGDIISRQAAIDEANAWLLDCLNVQKQNRSCGLIRRLEDLPPAQSEQKGEWISHYDYCKKHGYIPSGLIAFWWCDQCEQGVEHPTNFCPRCGSDMRGEQDE